MKMNLFRSQNQNLVGGSLKKDVESLKKINPRDIKPVTAYSSFKICLTAISILIAALVVEIIKHSVVKIWVIGILLGIFFLLLGCLCVKDGSELSKEINTPSSKQSIENKVTKK